MKNTILKVLTLSVTDFSMRTSTVWCKMAATIVIVYSYADLVLKRLSIAKLCMFIQNLCHLHWGVDTIGTEVETLEWMYVYI